MNEKLKKQLEAVITSCASKAADTRTTAIEALQYTQAAVNAANVITSLSCEARLEYN